MNNLNSAVARIQFPGISGKLRNIAKSKLTPVKFVNNHFLNALDSDGFNRLSPFLERVSFSGDEHIYQIQSNIDFIYFPETAVFSEYRILEDGRTNETAMIGAEGIVGLTPLIESKEATSWTQVLVPGKALKISQIKLKQEIENYNPLRSALFNYLVLYIEQISQKVVCNTHHLIEERFCSWLMMLRRRCQSDFLPLTHEQISRFLGVHRPTLTQIAKSMRAKGIIDYKRGQIEIQDYQKLKNFACLCFRDADK